MGIESSLWTDTSDDELLAAGNTPCTVWGTVGTHADLEVIWEGLAYGWGETATGGISLRRRVALDEDHAVAFEFRSFAAGRWAEVESAGYIYDLEMMMDQEREAARAQQHNATAQRLGVAPGPQGPNRQQRRHG
jgi:hypothetical protein